MEVQMSCDLSGPSVLYKR